METEQGILSMETEQGIPSMETEKGILSMGTIPNSYSAQFFLDVSGKNLFLPVLTPR